jgi:hypothetical protein
VHFKSKALERTILKICGEKEVSMLGYVRGVEIGVVVKCLGTYFLHVDAVACAAEDKACSHCFGESTGLLRNIMSVNATCNEVTGGLDTWFEISSWSSLGKLTKWSYFVPTRNGIAVLLNPLPCRYHSLILFRVLFLVKSNMKRIATASLQTRGNMLTNSRCPPKSQIEKVISVLRIEIVFSMKFTPSVWM